MWSSSAAASSPVSSSSCYSPCCCCCCFELCRLLWTALRGYGGHSKDAKPMPGQARHLSEVCAWLPFVLPLPLSPLLPRTPFNSSRHLKGHILHLSVVVPRKLRRRGRHKTFKIIKIFRATFITYTRGKAGMLNGGNNGEYAAYPFWHSSSSSLLLFFFIFFVLYN